MPEVNGLYPTPTRKALLRLIAAGGGRIYGEAGQVFDKQTYRRVTAMVKEFIDHEWVRALTPDEPRGRGETTAKGVTYYRLKDFGRQAMGGRPWASH
ncbi:hypothetical protein Drose_04520 [Dactylosporangium roseum]|uniref:Uncharacterized protein n=1 Tax=Dactylosporangium roseum TaxID=47989 RepID=A0ABY5Z684_9ACTN|nr:hypothetical protein [Dactylosporangium roseum]UWZ37554.1 hypothetical protein Drose_04520 [Dactylosporangium roseum]